MPKVPMDLTVYSPPETPSDIAIRDSINDHVRRLKESMGTPPARYRWEVIVVEVDIPIGGHIRVNIVADLVPLAPRSW